MIVVTSGISFLDIDAYASIIAYAALLQAQGKPAVAASSARPNSSVTQTILDWPFKPQYDYQPQAGDQFVLVDVSDVVHFDRIVTVANIIGVIDHHPGHDDYWQKQIGSAAQIEPIGAACTQVYEAWQTAGLVNQMPPQIAGMLICGILDNTLNFGAQITTDRDHLAYAALQGIAGLPADWPAQYFLECEQQIMAHPAQAILNDTKQLQMRSFKALLTVGQVAVWDANALIKELETEWETLYQKADNWILNIINISHGQSMIVSTDPAVQAWLSVLLDVSFAGPVAMANRLWLRKEILQKDISAAESY